MAEEHFNLVDEPWIQVIDQGGHQQMVSLLELFDHAQDYRQLAGEMHSQDLAILRFLLAILTTVYSRFNADGQSYDWLEIDPETMQIDTDDEDDLNDNYRYNEDVVLETWHALHERGQFTAIVSDYLKHYRYRFDLLDDKYPFYQVTHDEYNSMVKFKPRDFRIETGKGTVGLKQINRTISESGNKPIIFSPRSEENKSVMNLAELTRWLITYQNFTGKTDKAKIKAMGSLSVSGGWLYSFKPVFIKGTNLFETLLFNLDLSTSNTLSLIEHPVWEFDLDEYVSERVAQIMPNNLAELYTIWARVLHLEWNGNQPTIYSAGLPAPDSEGSFIEPMAVWKKAKKSKNNIEWHKDRLRINDLSQNMWRNFGEYVPISDDKDHSPGIVDWLHTIQDKKYIDNKMPITMTTIALVNDGKTSQMPVAEVYDQMQLRVNVLFDDGLESQEYWPARIEEVIDQTNKVGKYYRDLATGAGKLSGMENPSDYAHQLTDRFYDRLNEPFYSWLAGLTIHDDRDQKCAQWRQTLRRLSYGAGQRLLDNASPQEIRGKVNKKVNKLITIFNLYHCYNHKISLILGKKKESRVANEQ